MKLNIFTISANNNNNNNKLNKYNILYRLDNNSFTPAWQPILRTFGVLNNYLDEAIIEI